jgi:hypothetical protein
VSSPVINSHPPARNICSRVPDPASTSILNGPASTSVAGPDRLSEGRGAPVPRKVNLIVPACDVVVLAAGSALMAVAGTAAMARLIARKTQPRRRRLELETFLTRFLSEK